ncbi:hypothetical protein OE88DRAFT_1724120 [Heliocybe sulcata]|uniref:Uncharacterized protein n=1 Tax=Heliocybe sulcata TaxID=5364 RepID=A0A5C3NA05_9AGAM|nr:hypothetical protein OE88DRAFT_1724120 [Heliocybe sulcata]
MGMKRKFDAEAVDAFPTTNHKQMKLVPFPSDESDNDVAMSDASMSDAEPMMDPYHHIRLPSTASTMSTSSDGSAESPASYPSFDLYPFPNAYGANQAEQYLQSTYMLSPETSAKMAALLEPRNTVALRHYSPNCSQIPKLRIACATGLTGSRTMWSHCEQCGAIQMVDSD